MIQHIAEARHKFESRLMQEGLKKIRDGTIKVPWCPGISEVVHV